LEIELSIWSLPAEPGDLSQCATFRGVRAFIDAGCFRGLPKLVAVFFREPFSGKSEQAVWPAKDDQLSKAVSASNGFDWDKSRWESQSPLPCEADR
jgi:hypothetical protein